jgi:hypothetical protein
MTPERLLSTVCDLSTPFNVSREVLSSEKRMNPLAGGCARHDNSKTRSSSLAQLPQLRGYFSRNFLILHDPV